MTTPLSHTAHTAPDGISASQWESLRRESRRLMPVACAGANLPDVLLPYQQELFYQLDLHDVVAVEKSRRTGFTWGVGSRAVLYSAAAPDAGGMDSLYIGYNLEMAREFIDVCAMWAKAFAQAAGAVDECLFEETDESGEKHSIKAFRITFASGFEVVALSARPRSLRGKQGFVIIDEAAFHDDLPGLLKAALALLMWGGKVLVISTHNGEENPFNLLITEIKKGEKAYGLMKVDLDRALAEGLYRRICLVRGQEWSEAKERAWRENLVSQYGADADEELFCIPRSEGSAYAFISLGAVQEAMERPLPDINAQALVLGVDVARFGADSSVIFPRKGRDGRSIPFRVYRGFSGPALAREVIQVAAELSAVAVFVDGGGVGAGVCDTLSDLGFPFFEIAFGGKSDNPRCLNKRADMYFAAREWLKTGCLPLGEAGEQLKRELIAPRYSFTGPDIIKLESKDEIRKRLGLSPDVADAFALTFAQPVYEPDPVQELIESVRTQQSYDPRQAEYGYDPRQRR